MGALGLGQVGDIFERCRNLELPPTFAYPHLPITMDTEKVAVDRTPATAQKRTALQAGGFLLLVLSYQTLGK